MYTTPVCVCICQTLSVCCIITVCLSSTAGDVLLLLLFILSFNILFVIVIQYWFAVYTDDALILVLWTWFVLCGFFYVPIHDRMDGLTNETNDFFFFFSNSWFGLNEQHLFNLIFSFLYIFVMVSNTFTYPNTFKQQWFLVFRILAPTVFCIYLIMPEGFSPKSIEESEF